MKNLKLSKVSRDAVKEIRKIVLRKYIISYGVYLFCIYPVSWIFYLLFTRKTWYGNEPFYNLFHWIKNNLETFISILAFVGFIVILVLLFKALERYILIILEANEKMMLEDDEYIILPNELKSIESIMNKTKLTSRNNIRLLKDTQKQKEDLIMYLAHDLKTPLTSVIGYLSIVNETENLPEDVKQKFLNIALEKSYRLEDLINEFFDITRFNLNQAVIEKKKLNLSMLIYQIEDEFYPSFKEKGIETKLDIQDDINIFVDPDKIARVFDNIIRNAVAYCYDNSKIDIVVKKFIENVEIRIKNQGDTIPKYKIDNIFEQFYRVDSSRSTKGGAGLGLAIAKEIVEMHNGTIKVKSENQETEFIVTLPLE
jgi:two-component system sensor histidine kinase VanS